MSRQGPDGSWTSVKNGTKPKAAEYPKAEEEFVQGTFDWGDVDGRLIAGAVGRITSRGDAVSYAANRSRTQGSITILSGAERPRYTFSSVASAERWLQAVMDL